MYGRPPTNEKNSITRKLTKVHDRRKIAFIKGIIITTSSSGTSIRSLERSCHERPVTQTAQTLSRDCRPCT
jgi:hypothetical protein